jgi:hypothetical protein
LGVGSIVEISVGRVSRVGRVGRVGAVVVKTNFVSKVPLGRIKSVSN